MNVISSATFTSTLPNLASYALADNYACSVYPLIDPAPHFAGKTYKDKVIIITGGSTGIGATAALFYAKAGAKVIIVARRPEKLEKCKKDIEQEAPEAQVMIMVGDISDIEVGRQAVKAAVNTYGRLDIVLANQFSIMGGPMGSTSAQLILIFTMTRRS